MREPTQSRCPPACKGFHRVAKAPPPPHHARRRCGPHSQSQSRGSLQRARGRGPKGARPKLRSHWLRRLPRQSLSVLQTLSWGGFEPGLARSPAALPTPAYICNAATLPGPPPRPAPRPIHSPVSPAPLALKRLGPPPRYCSASFPSAASTEDALPKPGEQSLEEATGGRVGVDVGQGREMGHDRAVSTAQARIDEWLRSRLGLRLRSDLGPVPSIPGASVPFCEIARALNDECQGFHLGATRPRDQPQASRWR